MGLLEYNPLELPPLTAQGGEDGDEEDEGEEGDSGSEGGQVREICKSVEPSSNGAEGY
jgi:hypothetical protein